MSGASWVFERIAAPNTFEPEDTPLDVRGMMRCSTVQRGVETSFASLFAGEAIVDDDVVQFRQHRDCNKLSYDSR